MPESPLHLTTRLNFSDHLDRSCSVYAECLIPPGQNLPAILHCVGGAQQVAFADLKFWADQGYACASFDWQIGDVGGRTPERTSHWPEEVVAQSLPQNSIEQAILPLALQAGQVTLDWLCAQPSVDADRIGVSGISWGGYLTWLIAANNPRVRAIIPVYGCGIFTPNRRNPYSEELAEHWRQHWDPVALAPRQSAAACFLNGSNDFFGELDTAETLLTSLAVPHRHSYLPNADHAIGPGESALASAWMRHVLQDGPPLPATPKLSTSLKIESDTSQPIDREEIWWTADSCASRFACWHFGTPPDPTLVHRAFAKVVYTSGISLCSHLQTFSETESSVNPTTRFPDGLGWRWELGSTQLHGNEVQLQPLDEGKRIHILPPEKEGINPVAVLLHQIRHPQWHPQPGQDLYLGWEQATVPTALQAVWLIEREQAIVEVPTPCTPTPQGYKLQLPPGQSWTEVRDVRIVVDAPREPFILGPLLVR